jgi:transcription antitermination factor NusG
MPENRVGRYLLKAGDRVAIIAGHFEGFEGTVLDVEQADGVAQRVGIELIIFGRATRIDLSVEQVEPT